ncbi:MAG: SAM-dependent chlorinase/fluorinase [bacterium]|nr:SAM-dependent chlorinase/fluorinase [bacterium]
MNPKPNQWQPSGVVTLTTDFGTTDPYVGVMKGVLHTDFSAVRCVDLTHAVDAQDVRTAAWYLAHSWRYFPPGTVHVAVVDPGVGSTRSILVALQGGHAFLAPDNGLLGPILTEGAEVFELDVERFARCRRSNTFHGRDIFAPAAAAIAGGLDPRDAGAPAVPAPPITFPAPVRSSAEAMELEVLLVDRFGNLVTNYVAAETEASLAGWSVEIAGQRVEPCATYADATPGELLALVDSYGHLEIAVRDGDAASTLGLGRGAGLTLRRVGQ